MQSREWQSSGLVDLEARSMTPTARLRDLLTRPIVYLATGAAVLVLLVACVLIHGAEE